MTIFNFLGCSRFDLVLISPVSGRFLDEVGALGGNCRTLTAQSPLRRHGGSIPGAGPVGKIAVTACIIWSSIRLIALVRDKDLRDRPDQAARRRAPGIWSIKDNISGPSTFTKACAQVRRLETPYELASGPESGGHLPRSRCRTKGTVQWSYARRPEPPLGVVL